MDPEGEKSKSQIKRERLALQDLGRELTELPEKYLVKLPLNEALCEEIRNARQMSRSALQRQLRYIGGLLPNEDVETIRQALYEVLHPVREDVAEFHQIETWRYELLAGGEPDIDAVLARFPSADRQQLRQLVRNARKEQNEDKPPKSARLLFKYLRDL